MFKSYYVVWKPTEQEKIDVVNEMFKSYYVVWKLGLLTGAFKNAVSFKSYYVVWKPYEVTTANDGRYRLNRTM